MTSEYTSPSDLIEKLRAEDVDALASYFEMIIEDSPSLQRDRQYLLDGIDVSHEIDLAVVFGEMMAEKAAGVELGPEDYEDVFGPEGEIP